MRQSKRIQTTIITKISINSDYDFFPQNLGQGCYDVYDNVVVWTRIFHVRPHSIGETCFCLVKNQFLEKSESPLILF